MNFEEKINRIKDLRPIDDVFFEVLAQNKGVCEEILQTIIGDPNLRVLETITQSSEKNLYGRSVRLDALCVLGDNSKCNIEVQRSDIDDGSDIAALMSCFLRKEVNNPKFPKLSNEVTRLKSTQGGASAVCEVMEKYAKEYAKEYAEEYAKEYAEETAIRTKIEAYLELGASKEKTIKVLMEQYNLTEQTAIEKYNEYAQ